ncbi:MAG: type II toxin-antitoxin system HicB family antitoxin [Dehalococcoidia bacterium]|nr:type II toxin-antitoxin system HicB family antitoxin [Dehalococcoidia bacterium]
MEYTIAITKTPDGNYMATCPFIPEAVAQGETIEECTANMKEVLELCIEFRRERGEEIPKELEIRKVQVAA